ncbi:hypothetical protein DNL40_13385 [Xylanimonas oleitrophica]|uniref:1,4-alpha-glucan branching enzyme n=1 Tax=Xylanimonas oleitrophica TaxID=2607479 RepID=A0A2W5WWH3_9MICO|nr:hypothetical protein [Xylanimonas oleitrophica]PZR52185.1 hypothetical protein DNL40_13385 [Xylanimonas oleitrophica]
MTSETKTTTDHEEVRRWVDARGGTPAVVRDARDDGGGVLRIDFPGGVGGDRIETVSWDEWFSVFEDRGLALRYQAEKADGGDSTFAKLVSR